MSTVKITICKEGNRLLLVPASGDLVFALGEEGLTNQNVLYVGDGATNGGIRVSNNAAFDNVSTNRIRTNELTVNDKIETNTLILKENNLKDYCQMEVYSKDGTFAAFNGLIQGDRDGRPIVINHSRGTFENTEPVEQGDSIGGILWRATLADGNMQNMGILAISIEGSVTDNATTTASQMFLGVSLGNEINDDTPGLRITNKGVSSSTAFKAKPVTTSQRNSLGAGEGTIIFNSEVKKFQGYNGSAWVDLS